MKVAVSSDFDYYCVPLHPRLSGGHESVPLALSGILGQARVCVVLTLPSVHAYCAGRERSNADRQKDESVCLWSEPDLTYPTWLLIETSDSQQRRVTGGRC